MAISATSRLLSSTFKTQGFRLFRPSLWLFVWSKSPFGPGTAAVTATYPKGLCFMFRFGVLYLCWG